MDSGLPSGDSEYGMYEEKEVLRLKVRGGKYRGHIPTTSRLLRNL